jgi:hypothetical protein
MITKEQALEILIDNDGIFYHIECCMRRLERIENSTINVLGSKSRDSKCVSVSLFNKNGEWFNFENIYLGLDEAMQEFKNLLEELT